jgi:hypothetical protein
MVKLKLFYLVTMVLTLLLTTISSEDHFALLERLNRQILPISEKQWIPAKCPRGEIIVLGKCREYCGIWGNCKNFIK